MYRGVLAMQKIGVSSKESLLIAARGWDVAGPYQPVTRNKLKTLCCTDFRHRRLVAGHGLRGCEWAAE